MEYADVFLSENNGWLVAGTVCVRLEYSCSWWSVAMSMDAYARCRYMLCLQAIMLASSSIFAREIQEIIHASRPLKLPDESCSWAEQVWYLSPADADCVGVLRYRLVPHPVLAPTVRRGRKAVRRFFLSPTPGNTSVRSSKLFTWFVFSRVR